MFEFLNNKKVHLYAPVNGRTICLDDVPDKVFSSHMMGEGIAFEFNDNIVCSPCDGVISLIPSTLHAFGIYANNGAEILVHIGLDTVYLNGKGFEKLATQGDKVKKGTPIIKIDRQFMNQQIVSLITPVVITNSNNYDIAIHNNRSVKVGESKILEVKKK